MRSPEPDRVVAPIVAGLWESYLREVLPHDAPAIQILECKRAFYAGCQALLGRILAAVSDGEEVHESDLAMMDSIDRELKEFGESGGLS